MTRTSLLAATLLLSGLGAEPALANWDRPEWQLRLETMWESEMYPGYEASSSDQGLGGEASIATGTRLSSAWKLGAEAKAGGKIYSHFDEARQGWFGGEISLRRGPSRAHLAIDWTPSRVKFPSQPDNAAFSRLAWRVGFRHRASRALQLRLEGGTDRDDFIPAFDARDARATELRARADWAMHPPLLLRFELRGARERASATNYSHWDAGAVIGGGLALNRSSFESYLALEDRHYDEALVDESNASRKDREIALGLQYTHHLTPNLSARLGAELHERLSTRVERSYGTTVLRFGVQWAGGGK